MFLMEGVQINPNIGVISPETGHYTKRLSELRSIFQDGESLERSVREGRDPIVYEVAEYRKPGSDLFFGTTTIAPGTVGDEYYMTRGHFHERRDMAEVYYAQNGTGLLLLESRSGETATVEMSTGVAALIPPDWAHRSINQGDDRFVFMWVCGTAAGQDYSDILKKGMRKLLVCHKGKPELIDNPNWFL